MSALRSTRIQIITLALVALLASSSGHAVSLIAGVPNAEVTAEGTFMVAHESQFPFDTSAAKSRWLGFTFFTYGLGHDLELASTVYNISSPASGRIAASMGYKWTPLLTADREWLGVKIKDVRGILGQEFPVVLQGRGGIGNWSFAGVGVRLASTLTRFTLGINYGTAEIFGREIVDAFWGVEQPITKQWSVLADAFTGHHDFGAIITAVQWRPVHEFVLITGPKWSTAPGGDNSWMIELTLDL